MHERIAAAERGENPTVMIRMSTGWAVIGDTQHLPGYSLLLYAGTANHLSDLDRVERADFLMDMSILGEAVANACQRLESGFRRINYEILGNSFEHLHAHVHPRYEWEPPEHRHSPVWTYPDRKSPRYALSDRHHPLREAITAELQQLLHLTSVGERSDSRCKPLLRTDRAVQARGQVRCWVHGLWRGAGCGWVPGWAPRPIGVPLLSRAVQITVDAHDPRALSLFWRDALGYVIPAPPGIDLPEGADPFAAWDEFLASAGVPEKDRHSSSALEDPSGTGPRLFFQTVPENKIAKNRLHLDVRAAPGLHGDERMNALESECDRLLGLGAKRLERHEPAPPFADGHIIMADPEGNEFCLD